MDQIDLNDLEKMFNYADLYPTANELKEAKDNVLKCKINSKLIFKFLI